MQTENTAAADASDEAIKAAADVDSHSEPVSEPSGEPTEDFQTLATEFVGLSRFVNAIFFCVIGVVAVLLGSVLWRIIPFPMRLAIPGVWFVLGGWSMLSVIWWPRWEHDRWSYRVDDKVLQLRYGIVSHVSVSIPLSRLQHVDVHRGPLERRWDLASLEIHTAGTRDASHRIPGLEDTVASGLRDQLIDKANRAEDQSTNA